MLLQAFLVCLLVNAVSAQFEGNVIASVLRPRSLSPEAHDESIRRFWTTERFLAAKPVDITLPTSSSKTRLNHSNVTIGYPSHVLGSTPLHNITMSKAISSRGLQVKTTGRVFWHAGTWSYSCSASVVSSKTKDLIVTAAHCVYDFATKTWYTNNKWVFVPGFSNNVAPYGTWTARTVLVRQAWISSEDYNYDVAFVALSPLNKRHIQSVVGAQGISFNQPRSAYVYSFGYPVNLGNTLYLKSCVGRTQPPKNTQYYYVGQGLSCNMGHGCSGGPWLQNVADATGIGFVTSVNSFTVSSVPNVMNGPYFDTNTKCLYDQATSV